MRTDTSKTFTFTAIDDMVSDDGESVKIGFGSPLPTGVTATSPTETTVTIIDNIVDVVAQFEQPRIQRPRARLSPSR